MKSPEAYRPISPQIQAAGSSLIVHRLGPKATSPTFVRIYKPQTSNSLKDSQKQNPTNEFNAQQNCPAQVGVGKKLTTNGLTPDCVIRYLRVLVLMSTVILLALTLITFGLLLTTSDLSVFSTFECIYLVFETVIGFYGSMYRNHLATLIYSLMCGSNFILIVIVCVAQTVKSKSSPDSDYDAMSLIISWILAGIQFVQAAVSASIWAFLPRTTDGSRLAAEQS